MTRKQLILDLFQSNSYITCTMATKHIIAEEKLTGTKATYLSGSISTILSNLVKAGILEYAAHTTSRGGRIYQLKNTQD